MKTLEEFCWAMDDWLDTRLKLAAERDADWQARVEAARAEGKAEGLREALTQLPAMKPTGEDEDNPTCSVCHCMVSVESSDDWDDGDVCYHCAVELIPKARAEIEALIAKTGKP